MTMLRQRIITAAVLVPIMLFLIFLPQTYYFAVCIGLFLCIGAWEWAKLSALHPGIRCLYVLVFAGGLGAILVYGSRGLLNIIVIAGAVWWLFSLLIIIVYQRTGHMLFGHDIIKAGMGLLILIPAWTSLLLLHGYVANGASILLFLMLMVWLADSSAYFVGRKWGRKPLAVNISPGKTWEGIWGGLFAGLSLGGGYILAFDMDPISSSLFLGICFITILFSVLGDLMESILKRQVDMKDSGTILPGHGGILDRVDSMTAAGPVFVTGLLAAGLLE